MTQKTNSKTKNAMDKTIEERAIAFIEWLTDNVKKRQAQNLNIC